MTPEIAIPESISEVTSAWIELALQHDIPGCRIASIDVERIGEGVGFLGELGRVSIDYAADAPIGPASVIAKTATSLADPRAMAIGMGFYEREVGFYQEFSENAGARVPRCYFAGLRPDGGFALILEDFPEAVTGDQLASCSDDEAYLAVGEMAKLHAKWWQSNKLVDYAWLPTRGHAYFKALGEIYRQSLPVYEARCGEQFGPDVLRVTKELGNQYDEFIESMMSNSRLPLTLVHGDYRLDNMLFDRPEGGSPLIVLDWQLMQQAPGGMDLQYFIAGSLRNAARQRLTDDLIRYYHEILCQGGVRDHSLAQCRQGFVEMSTILVFFLVVGLATLNPDDYGERGNEIIELMYGSMATAILEYDAERWLPNN